MYIQETKTENILNVSANRWASRPIELTFFKDKIQVLNNGNIRLCLTKKQTTELIRVLKSQRDRKGVR